MDDVDAVQAQIGRNMLTSGDWVTARLDGVAYLEKAPLVYWMMGGSYAVFGVHDWSARLPLALAAILLCWVTFRFARWAFDNEEAGLYAGLALATCLGLFLFTRILIPDATLTLVLAVAVWAWLRLLEPEGASWRWSLLLGACLGAGLLLKSLIGAVFPVLSGLAYMAATRRLFSLEAWRRLRPGLAVTTALLIAVPWHVLATLRNPPYFAWTLHSGPAQYHGFLWFYFVNEQLLRFLNLRYPRDYNTVPRLWFWLLNLVWMFPWSAYLPGAFRLSYRPTTRAGRARLMAACWIGVVMVFFTFSTTQEYYSMPIYPALAILIGAAMAGEGRWRGAASRFLAGVFALLFVVLAAVLALVWRLPAPGDISRALTQNPALYTLSMGHLMDLTLPAFAYLKLPVAIAAAAFGATAMFLVLSLRQRVRLALILAAGMVVFFQAARLALIRFDPYLGSYPLAARLQQSPPGQLIEADAYYAFSSVFFYTNRTALLYNGRFNNLEYGSYAPNAPNVFIDDARFVSLWTAEPRCYLLAWGSEMQHLEELVGEARLHVVAESAGNYLLTNHEIP